MTSPAYGVSESQLWRGGGQLTESVAKGEPAMSRVGGRGADLFPFQLVISILPVPAVDGPQLQARGQTAW